MPGKTYTAKNGAKYVKDARGRVRFISGASKAYLAKIRKKRGKKRGGGLGRKAVKNLAIGAAGLGLGAATGGLATHPTETFRGARKIVKGTRQGTKAIRKGGNLRAKGPAKRKRRVKGGGFSLHSKTTGKYKAPGIRSKTSVGY